MRLRSLLSFVILLSALSPLGAAKLGQETWREEKRRQTLEGLRNWSRLSEPDTGVIVEENGRRFLRLQNGAKMQSIGVTPYGNGLALKGVLDITSPGGSAGFGFIDFSSGVYYYLFLDKTAGKVILQRGDRDASAVLAEAAVAGSSPFTLELKADIRDKRTISLQALFNGTPVLDANEAKPEKLGSIYQIYVGVGQDAVVDLLEITTIFGK
jgi:hypothetical protein